MRIPCAPPHVHVSEPSHLSREASVASVERRPEADACHLRAHPTRSSCRREQLRRMAASAAEVSAVQHPTSTAWSCVQRFTACTTAVSVTCRTWRGARRTHQPLINPATHARVRVWVVSEGIGARVLLVLGFRVHTCCAPCRSSTVQLSSAKSSSVSSVSSVPPTSRRRHAASRHACSTLHRSQSHAATRTAIVHRSRRS
jgi:hypothetical protein